MIRLRLFHLGLKSGRSTLNDPLRQFLGRAQRGKVFRYPIVFLCVSFKIFCARSAEIVLNTIHFSLNFHYITSKKIKES